MMLTMMFMLTAINLVPTTSREMAKTIMKIPWAPIPVTSLPQLGLNRVYIALGLAFLGSAIDLNDGKIFTAMEWLMVFVKVPL